MNRLSHDLRVQALSALVEGNSIRATCRMVGIAKGTALRLVEEIGEACGSFHYMNVHHVRAKRLQLDEIWTFCHAKERNVPIERRGEAGIGDIWTWVAIDPDTKLTVAWLLGDRSEEAAWVFLMDLRARVPGRVQISTDGFRAYQHAIDYHFAGDADYGMVIKQYGNTMEPDNPARRYSPRICTSVRKVEVNGSPDPKHISTSHVERANLTMRMQMRRFTRLTNGFSKKAENLDRALALHFVYYNFCRVHGSLKTTPAIAAGLTDRVWTLHDLARLPDLTKGDLAA